MASETVQSKKDKNAVKKENPAKLRRRASAKIDALLWRLKARLESRSEGAHVVGITSCCPGSGVTTTIANLAIRAADHHLGPVLLIDANSLRPRQHRQFRLNPKTGLGTWRHRKQFCKRRSSVSIYCRWEMLRCLKNRGSCPSITSS